MLDGCNHGHNFIVIGMAALSQFQSGLLTAYQSAIIIQAGNMTAMNSQRVD